MVQGSDVEVATTSGHPETGTPATTASQARTHWKVEDPEDGLRLVVAACTVEEAQALA